MDNGDLLAIGLHVHKVVVVALALDKLRECNNPPPSNGGLDCVGSGIRQHRCNTDACPGEKHINGLWKCMDKINQ